MKYFALKWFMRTVGLMSKGIRLGWRTGFDSGVMLEYVYENQAHGITPLGKWIDRKFLSNHVWDEVRHRRQLLIGQLLKAVTDYQNPFVFDMAAGVGSYLFSLPPNMATVIAGDFDRESIAAGNAKAQRLDRSDILFKFNNAFEREQLAAQHADILITSGFFDILVKDDEIQKVLANGSAITQPGARWVFTIEEHHPDLRVLKETMVDLHQRPWELLPRAAEVLVDWAKPHGWRLEKLERNAYFAVGTLVKEQ